MKLYAGATACSWAVQIALEVAKLPHEIDWVGPGRILGSGRNYLEVNPRGQVPALELDDGSLFTETTVLLQIVAAAAPQAKLTPQPGTTEHFRMLEMLSFLSSEVHKHSLWPLSNVVSYPGPAEPLQKLFLERLHSRLDYFENRVPDNGFFMGANLGAVDAYAVVMLHWSERRAGTLDTWPKLTRYYRRLLDHPVVANTQRANFEERDRLRAAGLPI
jgi:glutathione S-transferase